MAEGTERRQWWMFALVTVPAIVLLGSASGWLSGTEGAAAAGPTLKAAVAFCPAIQLSNCSGVTVKSTESESGAMKSMITSGDGAPMGRVCFASGATL